ncbi:MAG TPA: hypothetical protein VGR08_10475, partial [Thermomicrobiales bacterium]|nr:hypothetical protein [Thermomicrobiales bacterium]
MTTPDASRPGWIHPLITRVDPLLNRRRLLTLGATGLAAVLRAQSGSAQEATPEATPAGTPEGTPEGTPVVPGVASLGEGLTGDPEAVEILRNAARVMAELSTFAFEIETTRGE